MYDPQAFRERVRERESVCVVVVVVSCRERMASRQDRPCGYRGIGSGGGAGVEQALGVGEIGGACRCGVLGRGVPEARHPTAATRTLPAPYKHLFTLGA